MPRLTVCGTITCHYNSTLPLGFFHLQPRPYEHSLPGKMERGERFQCGKVEFSKRNLTSARELVKREYQEVKQAKPSTV